MDIWSTTPSFVRKLHWTMPTTSYACSYTFFLSKHWPYKDKCPRTRLGTARNVTIGAIGVHWLVSVRPLTKLFVGTTTFNDLVSSPFFFFFFFFFTRRLLVATVWTYKRETVYFLYSGNLGPKDFSIKQGVAGYKKTVSSHCLDVQKRNCLLSI